MYISVVKVHVKPECVEAFKEAILANARASVQEPGVARFDVLQELEDPTQFTLVEVYRNEEGLARHKETSHYATWAETVNPMMAERRTNARYRNVFPEDAGW